MSAQQLKWGLPLDPLDLVELLVFDQGLVSLLDLPV